MLNIKSHIASILLSALKNGNCSLEFKERMAWKEVTAVIRGVPGCSSMEEHGWVREAGLDHGTRVIRDSVAWQPLLCPTERFQCPWGWF